MINFPFDPGIAGSFRSNSNAAQRLGFEAFGEAGDERFAIRYGLLHCRQRQGRTMTRR